MTPTRPPVDSVTRLQRKKALLIGIIGQSSDGLALSGPHKDVMEMKRLIIDKYEYREEDITIMLDKPEYGDLQPTRSAILREIKNLVWGAQKGDCFFFHYCGHAKQIPNRNNSEEDGMDECLVPSDGNIASEEKIITDNELKRCLVDPLPVGSSLVAVFDACHSASLLDLKHIRCNRIWVPFVSKGRRRTKTLQNAMVRRPAILTSRHVYQNRRVSTTNVRSTKTSVDLLRGASKRLSIKTKSLSLKSNLDTPTGFSSPIRQCESPVQMYPCTGFCPPTKNNQADVISIGACKDSQLAWEDIDGSSMTTALIQILSIYTSNIRSNLHRLISSIVDDNPHPTLKELMTRVSHLLYELIRGLHLATRKYKKEVEQYKAAVGSIPARSASDGVQYDMDNFQNPQLASHQPLDMERPFAL